MYEIFQIILAMGTAWCISGLFRLSNSKKQKNSENYYAFAVILVFLLTILDNLLRPSFMPMNILQFIYPITRISYFLVGPSLFLYTKILLKKDFKAERKHLLHLIPFVIWFIYILIDPLSINPKISFGTTTVSDKIASKPLFSFSYIWDLSLNLSRVIYSCSILVMIRAHEKLIKDKYSTINRITTLSWFKYLVLFYTGIYLAFSIVNLILPTKSPTFQIIAALIRILPAVLFVFLFSFFSENQIILVSSNSPDSSENSKYNKEESKYKKSGISDDDKKSIYTTICNYVESSKIYLNSELTLDILSEKVGISRHKVSQAINEVANKRFYLFINDFRVKEFKDSIKTNKYPNYTIIAIAYECGFASSSGFYSIIKNTYGITPKTLVKEIKEGRIL